MTGKNPIPPYISYRTFRNFLVQLERQGLPGRIDRSVMAHKSGTVQSQLLLTLQFLGLIRESGKPTTDLEQLFTGDQRERAARWRELLQRAYPFVFGPGFDVQAATSEQAEELFSRTGASGETVRRCISFFLAAARDCDLPVSPYIRPHRGKKSRAAPARPNPETSPAAPSLPRPARPDGVEKTVRLRGEGRLTLRLDVDLFDLTEEDRRFVFGLIDRIREFEDRSD